jgi:LmbE family N-acetylglucosaminyl deacetylase
MTYDSLYLSPHLDDVAISCPARILVDRAEGRRVLVATIFSRGGADERARKREDRRAMRLLGVDHAWLDLADAPVHDPYYHSFLTIALGRKRTDREVLPALKALVERTSPERIYAPLAVGTHVDHRLAHDAARRLGRPLIFYEDRPYSFLRHAVAMRLAEIRAVPLDRMERPAPDSFLESVKTTPFLRAYIGPQERDRCVRILLKRIDRAARWNGRKGRVKLDAEFVRGHISRIEPVVACYRSQVGVLFGGRFRECALGYSRELGIRDGYAERFWVPRERAGR